MAAAPVWLAGAFLLLICMSRKRVSPRNPFSVGYSTDLVSDAAKTLSKADNNR